MAKIVINRSASLHRDAIKRAVQLHVQAKVQALQQLTDPVTGKKENVTLLGNKLVVDGSLELQLKAKQLLKKWSTG